MWKPFFCCCCCCCCSNTSCFLRLCCCRCCNRCCHRSRKITFDSSGRSCWRGPRKPPLRPPPVPGDHRGPLRRREAAPPCRVHPPGAALPPVAAGGDPRHHALRPAQDIQGPPQEEARGGKQGAGVNAGPVEFFIKVSTILASFFDAVFASVQSLSVSFITPL